MISKAYEIQARHSARIKGQRGAPRRRELVRRLVERHAEPRSTPQISYSSALMRRRALGLARMAEIHYDEHGSSRGDYLHTVPLDYVPPAESVAAPYLDMGRAGLGLVEVRRKRVYARSCTWGAIETSTVYLVGRNESGTFFAHAVPRTTRSVWHAIYWIWRGHNPTARQGDIAIVYGPGPRYPQLPTGHTLQADGTIVHDTHPRLRAPGKGERVIVARRAVARVSEETRD